MSLYHVLVSFFKLNYLILNVWGIQVKIWKDIKKKQIYLSKVVETSTWISGEKNLIQTILYELVLLGVCLYS